MFTVHPPAGVVLGSLASLVTLAVSVVLLRLDRLEKTAEKVREQLLEQGVEVDEVDD